MKTTALLLGASLFTLSTAAALAEEIRFHAHLSGEQQVPPVETDAMGSADVMFDTETSMLSWTLEYEGLSGDPVAAHFHGPAHPGENAPPVVPIEEFESGSEGSAELTEEQMTELMNGHLYINIHTEANPDGEIRGQVFPAMAETGDTAGGAMEGETMEGEPMEGEPMEGEPMEGEPMEGEAADGATMGGDATDGAAMEDDAMEGEAMQGEAMEAEPTEAEPMEGAAAADQAMAGDNPMVGGAPMLADRNIIENAVNSADHTTLVAAVQAAELVDALSGEGPFTVFAPTNQAFENLPAGTVDTLLMPENREQLTKVLTAHVVADNLSGADLMSQAEANGGRFNLETLSGDTLTVAIENGNVVVYDEAGGAATVTIADVRQSNGVIHVVDDVLLPE